ncbi:hypothetical protein K504DRAFT_488300 [Pleomassaria siparia CBS 279.74]|uniref:Uncharacterized protein n=1 Tax=Pleomassaria siparia CBS 279.74 TaxID=1314801 RepID=A0A6G1KMH8_9PLEO|nr:hypothetical protein K504DRAFT_488300 [Pleomassaria siparia CBS 279.74]
MSARSTTGNEICLLGPFKEAHSSATEFVSILVSDNQRFSLDAFKQNHSQSAPALTIFDKIAARAKTQTQTQTQAWTVYDNIVALAQIEIRELALLRKNFFAMMDQWVHETGDGIWVSAEQKLERITEMAREIDSRKVALAEKVGEMLEKEKKRLLMGAEKWSLSASEVIMCNMSLMMMQLVKRDLVDQQHDNASP